MKFLALILFALLAPSQSGDPEVQSRLRASFESYDLEADSFVRAILQFSADFRIPVGLEWVVTKHTSSPIRLSLQKSTPLDVLTAILLDHPEYGFEEHQDYISIAPRGAQKDQTNVLNLVIERFEAKDTILGLAKANLFEMVRYTADRPTTSSSAAAGVGRSIGIGYGGNKPVNVVSDRKRFRDILSLLAVSAGETSWVVTYPEKPSFMDNGYRRTVASSKGEMPPDRQQPVVLFEPWDVLQPRQR
jgi:hypothetical protein